MTVLKYERSHLHYPCGKRLETWDCSYVSRLRVELLSADYWLRYLSSRLWMKLNLQFASASDEHLWNIKSDDNFG